MTTQAFEMTPAEDAELIAELMEKAAKIVGAQRSLVNKECWLLADSDGVLRVWQPSTDDGDSMRLAIHLYFGVKVNGPTDWQNPNTTVILFDGPVCGHRLMQEHNGNPARATRRAILRAAAVIADANNE